MRNFWPVKSILLLGIFLAFTTCVPAQKAGMSADEAHRKAEALLKQMNLDEKIGQMNGNWRDTVLVERRSKLL